MGEEKILTSHWKIFSYIFPPSPSDRATENSLESEKPRNLAWPKYLSGKIKAKGKKRDKKMGNWAEGLGEGTAVRACSVLP